MELIKNLSKAIVFLIVVILTVKFMVWLHQMLMWFVIFCVFSLVLSIVFRRQVWSGFKRLINNRNN